MIPRQVAVEYKVDKAGPNVEREQLNRILEEIKRQIANLGGDVNYVTQQQLQDALDTIVFPPSGGGIVNTVVGGYAISVDSTDPANPVVALDIVGDGNPGDVITSDGAGGISWQPTVGGIASIAPGDGIDVDATDPDNPEVSAKISTDASNALSIGTDGGLYATAGGGGGGVQVDVYDTPGAHTWNKPAGAASVEVIIVGGGGGGGGGGGPATGGAGGGGGGGAAAVLELLAANVPSSVSIIVGAGGNGGAPVNSTLIGNPGAQGGVSSFGTFRSAYGGGGGLGGRNAQAPGGGGGGVFGAGSDGSGGTSSPGGAGGGAQAPLNAAVPDNLNIYGGAAGSPGRFSPIPNGGRAVYGAQGGACGGSTGVVSGQAGSAYDSSGTLSLAGGAAGVDGAFATGIATTFRGAGGAGGGSTGGAGISPGDGGAGQQPGGGGGGGGGTNIAAQDSGAGGNGADGIVVVVTYF